MGGHRADAGVRGRRRRDGSGRARPLALDVPGLKALGVEANEDAFGGDKRLALLDAELRDWTAVVAANLLVDGVLTTFVASCVDSSLGDPDGLDAPEDPPGGGLAPRTDAEAWARRLCRGEQRDAFVARLLETWEHAGRWIGPDDDPEYAAAPFEAGEVRDGPAAQRELMEKLAPRAALRRGRGDRPPRAHLGRLGSGARRRWNPS